VCNLEGIFNDSRFKRVDVERHYPNYGRVLVYFNEADRLVVLVAMKSAQGDDYILPEAALRGLCEKQQAGRVSEAYVVFANGTRAEPVYTDQLTAWEVLEVVKHRPARQSKYGPFWWFRPEYQNEVKPF
jgi:hypothetical protein